VKKGSGTATAALPAAIVIYFSKQAVKQQAQEKTVNQSFVWLTDSFSLYLCSVLESMRRTAIND